MKTLPHVQRTLKAAAVHWLSAFGLMRVHESSDENWQWAFASADVIGQHLWSQPASDMFSLYQLWRQVDQLFPHPWKGKLSPHMLTGEGAAPRLVYPVFYEDKFLGVLVVENPKDTNPVS